MSACLFICDDDPVAGTVFSLDLIASGFDVAPQLYSVADAIEALARKQPDLMLLDLHMPTGSGLDLLDYLAETGLYPDLPILMLTGEDDAYYIERARDLGAMGYLTKPSHSGSLAVKVVRILEDTSLRWIDDVSALTEPGPASMANSAFNETAAGRAFACAAPLDHLTPTVGELARLYGTPAVEGLLQSLVRQLGKIDLAAETELEMTAHAIRGAAASLGFVEVADTCHALEIALKAEQPLDALAHDARDACRSARVRITQALAA